MAPFTHATVRHWRDVNRLEADRLTSMKTARIISNPFARVVAFAAAIALPGCSTVPTVASSDALLRGKSLDDAEKLLASAKEFRDSGDAAAVYRIRAAEIAWAN